MVTVRDRYAVVNALYFRLNSHVKIVLVTDRPVYARLLWTFWKPSVIPFYVPIRGVATHAKDEFRMPKSQWQNQEEPAFSLTHTFEIEWPEGWEIWYALRAYLEELYLGPRDSGWFHYRDTPSPALYLPNADWELGTTYPWTVVSGSRFFPQHDGWIGIVSPGHAGSNYALYVNRPPGDGITPFAYWDYPAPQALRGASIRWQVFAMSTWQAPYLPGRIEVTDGINTGFHYMSSFGFYSQATVSFNVSPFANILRLTIRAGGFDATKGNTSLVDDMTLVLY